MRKSRSPSGLTPGFLVLIGLVVGSAVPPTADGATLAQFGTATNFPAGASPGGIAVGDFNHDGKQDIAVVNLYGHVSVLWNLGNGTFAAPTNFSVNAFYIAVGDFNNDGNLDIVAVPNASGSYVSVLLGDGTGNFRVNTSTSFYAGYTSGVSVGDFNGDGILDLAIADDTSVTIALGVGDGSFAVSTNVALAGYNYGYGDSIRACDLYGNGKMDVVLSLSAHASSNCFCVLSNKGGGSFAAPAYYGVAKTNFFGGYVDIDHYSLELGDFNGDGKLDIALLNWYRSGPNPDSVTIWISGGKGAFTPAHEYALGFSPNNIAQGDFNGDGRIDLVVRGGGTARLLLGNGDGSFTMGSPMTVSSDSFTYGTAVAAGDFDGNGTPDLAFENHSSNSVAVILNQTPPTLQLTPLAGYNQINWPKTFGTGFTLEYTTNLAAPASWQRFPYPPVLIGNQQAVADWADGVGKFYRLRKQSW